MTMASPFLVDALLSVGRHVTSLAKRFNNNSGVLERPFSH